MKSKKGMTGVIICSLLLVIAIVFSIIMAVNFENMANAFGKTTAAVTRAEATALGKAACKNIETEGATLLYNKDNFLPLNKPGGAKTKITALGAGTHNYVQGGTGSAGGRDDSDTAMFSTAFANAGIDYNKTAWQWMTNALGNGSDVHNGSVDTNYLHESDTAVAGWDWTAYRDVHEFKVETYRQFVTSSVIGDYKTAVVTFSRSGAEGASPSLDYDGNGDTTTGRHYLELTDNERDLLAFCKSNFDSTVVLINSAIPMECGFIEDTNYNIKAAMWIGHPGESGIEGVADLLAGNANPSGHLVDTFAYDMSTAPSFYSANDQQYTNITMNSKNKYYQYNEGIYIGYRYYETADAAGYFDSAEFKSVKFKGNTAPGKYTEGTDYAAMKTAGPQITYAGYEQVVQFPFGYGLSYTTFTQEIISSEVPLTANGTNSVKVKVTNTGSVAGKDVVQLYYEAPYATSKFGISGVGLEQAKVVLVGMGKTDMLQPNGSQEITINFNTDEIASFDAYNQGCYINVGGEYKFHVSPNAHGWANEEAYGKDYGVVTKTLSAPIIYKAKPATGVVEGAQYVELRKGSMNGVDHTEGQSAVNQMNDITAGDGTMLINGGASGTYKLGYLSRSNFHAGMKEIMSFQTDDLVGKYSGNGKVFGTETAISESIAAVSGSKFRKAASASVKQQIEASPKDISTDGINGESGTVGEVGLKYTYKMADGISFGNGETHKYLYGFGNDYVSTVRYTRDGVKQDNAMYDVLFDQKYYVAVNGDGVTLKADDGYVAIYDTEVKANAAAEGYEATLLQGQHMNAIPREDLDRWTMLANMLSFEEADSLMGDNRWQTPAAPSIGKEMRLWVDGPGEAGNAQNAGCTWWPCAVIVAATWNPECAEKDYGVNYGYQDLLNNVPYCYSPAANTHRTPFGGRNFEYYSEDGFIAGVICGYAVQGLQSVGMSVAVKHMGLNDSDTNRGGVNTWADEQSIREIYSKPYEIAVKYFEADGIMGSLNSLGMAWSHSGHYTEMIRNEWAWIGMLITDGDGTNSLAYNYYDYWTFGTSGGLLGGGKLSTHTQLVNVGTNGENATKYQKYVIHQVGLNAAYQWAHNIDVLQTVPDATVPTVLLIVINAVLLVAIVILVFAMVIPGFKKKD